MALLTVKTTYGIVRGVEGENGGNTRFLGIPFAKPPIGELRFAPPVQPDAWEGERLCDQFSCDCIQRGRGPGAETKPVENISEDCLYLNVFTPANFVDEKLPVMFWIYGGGFGGGRASDPEFDGDAINAEGAILVTFNYRCGPLGFFALPELDEKHGGSKNLGLLDQIMALKWVKENISAFGGDPEKVMVFGQSAGGISTRMLLTSPAAKGLFSRAAIHSGGGLNEADPVRPKDEFTGICKKCMEYLGWTYEDIMTRDAEEINAALDGAARATVPGHAVGYFQPFVDGYSLTDVPGKLVKEGKYADIPILSGTVAGDAWMFSRLVRDQLNDNVNYFRGFSFSPELAWAIWNNQCGRTPIYTYYMDRKQPEGRGHSMQRNGPPPFGATTPHSSDIAYVFGTLSKRNSSYKEYDYELSRVMLRYWINFAQTGDPNGNGLPDWPQYTEERPLTMHFAEEYYKAEDIIFNDEERAVLEHTILHPGMLDTAEGL